MDKRVAFKGGIKRKVTLTIMVAISVVLLSGVALVYSMGLNLLSNALGTQYEQAAQRLGSFIRDNMNGELEDAKVYTNMPGWLDIIKDTNLKYKDMDPKDIVPYLKSMDKKWISSKKDDPLLWGYLNNRISVALRNIVSTRGGIAELFLTDKYGGLAAASGKTSDFYQAEEEWWQEAYNAGKGGIYVSNVEFDESSGCWAISIAVPMKDESGAVIGVCKNSLDIRRLFSNISVFGIGKTGRAFLVNEEGEIVFPQNSPYANKRLFSKEALKKLLSGRKRFMFTHSKAIGGQELFMAFSELSLPVTKKGYSRWAIFIVQEASEMSLPLNKFVAELAFITGCLVIFMIPLGLFFGERITRPIQKLYEATERFMAGDRDYKVDIKTGDEIEQFAIMFNDMLTDIGDKQARLENFSHDLEDKVEERTKKLSESQEATLNILEDLEDAKASLEKSNKELKKLDQLKSDFVSTVSHELRTPLSIIKEGVSLVIDKVPGDINEQQNKILEISKFNIDRLARIIDSLLDISKIDAGKVELKRSLINVADIAKQVAVSFEIKVREKGLELKLDVDDNAGMVYADSDRITQVFTNLVANAVKFTTSGYIAISCRPADDEIVCAVKDTGVGISKLDLPKIFDKFQQFGRLAGAGEKGTGLGLSIAKGIIDMHEGQISVESEPGKGSCFTFVLHKYTEASLFNDAVDRAIKTAAQSKAKVSIIRVSSRLKAGLAGQNLRANFHAAMIDGARSIKNTLRRQDDRVINNEGDMLIVLVNCSREHCAPVRARLEEILNKFFEERKLRNALDVQYGCATFPDDGRTSVELINKASAFAGHKRHA